MMKYHFNYIALVEFRLPDEAPMRRNIAVGMFSEDAQDLLDHIQSAGSDRLHCMKHEVMVLNVSQVGMK